MVVFGQVERPQCYRDAADGCEEDAAEESGGERDGDGRPPRALLARFAPHQQVVHDVAGDGQERDDDEEPASQGSKAEDEAVDQCERPDHGDAGEDGDDQAEETHEHAKE